MYCENCGGVNESNSVFCNNCGHLLENEQKTLIKPSLPPPPEIPTQVIDFRGNPTINLPLNTPSKPERSNKGLVFAGVVFAGLLLISIIAIAVANKNNNTAVNSTPNSSLTSKTATPITSSTVDSSTTLPNNFDRSYEGTISGQNISMTLKRDGDELKGTAATSRTDYLYGKINSDGEFRLEGYENDNKLTGIYKGRIYPNGSISGTWTTPQGTKPTTFSLSEQ